MLKFEITFGDLLTIIAIVLTLLIYLHSRSVEKRIQKASFLRDYLILFLQSPLSDTFFDVDYGKLHFSSELIGSKDEIRLTQLLEFLNNLCFNYYAGIIERKDLEGTTFGYAILRVCTNPDVQKYLAHIDAHDMESGYEGVSFAYLRRFAREFEQSNSRPKHRRYFKKS
jgi:hypothetical protein